MSRCAVDTSFGMCLVSCRFLSSSSNIPIFIPIQAGAGADPGFNKGGLKQSSANIIELLLLFKNK